MQEQIEAVQRMQDFIEEHINESITLADLANVSFFLHGMLIDCLKNIQTLHQVIISEDSNYQNRHYVYVM